LRELGSPQNRRAALLVSVLAGSVLWLARQTAGPGPRGLIDLVVCFFNIGYGLQAIREVHIKGNDAVLPGPATLITAMPLALSFCLANLPHLLVMILLTASALILGSKALIGLGLWVAGLYFLVWMFAYDALAINFTRFFHLSDALDLKKAFRTIGQARSPYFQAALLPFIFTYPIYMALGVLDLAYHLGGWPILIGLILSQLSILWNLMALKQWVALLQPTPHQTQEPGLNPS